MAYSTDEDIFDRLGEDVVRRLTDDDSSDGVDTTLLSRIRESVADEMNVFLRGSYDLPIEDEEATDVLAGLEVDILAYRLYARRPTAEVPSSVEELKDDAFDRLSRIARHGGLGVDQDGDGEPDGGSSLTVRGPEQQTLSDKMEGRY